MATTELRAQAGQLITFGFEGTAVDERLRALVRELQPGGIILFARNIEAPGQTWELLRAAQALVATPLFRCVDMEGGTVDRLKNVIAPSPAAALVAASGNLPLFRRHGHVIGDACRALGFNVDFAPVVDLAFAASQSVLGSRAVSLQGKATVAYAREFLQGLKDAGVLGCIKHFPGLGEANLDTHFELPAIAKPWKKLWEEDLVPYRALKSAPFVMVAHARYPAVDAAAPASLSKKWLGEVLRRKIGYQGLAIADDLEMGGVQVAAGIEEAAVETIRAGADIFLVCRNEEYVRRTYEAVVRVAESDPVMAKRVRESARRVLAYKKKWKLSRKLGPAPSGKKVAALVAALQKLHQAIEQGAASTGPGTRWD